jgi:hypothetical protein
MRAERLLCGVMLSWVMSNPLLAAEGAIPNFAPDAVTSWIPDRPAGDDFLPPKSGPGPVLAQMAHPYIPNGQGQPTYRVADLTNPILKDWVKVPMQKANDDVLAGKVPFAAKERCWPAGVPNFHVFRRVELVYFVQTAKEVLIIHEADSQVRHVAMNVAHSANLKPSWYGDSVGRYDGDTLVVDTVGLNDKTFIDNYRTPHTEKLHVVERLRVIDGGKTLEATITVDDPDAFTTPWTAIQRYARVTNRGPLVEEPCAENNFTYFGYDVLPIPEADRPEF